LIRGDESKKELPGKRTRVIDLQQILDELTPITVSPSSPTEYLLDIADLFDRTGESLRRTKLILNSFLGAYQEHLAAINTSLEARDTDGAIIPSHSIKGLLLDVGAKGTATIAAALEAASKAGDVESALQSHHALEERMRQVAQRVDDVVKHPIFNAAL
jgi:HPt (histidine-containing phosphotransfer) domain-containing protein